MAVQRSQKWYGMQNRRRHDRQEVLTQVKRDQLWQATQKHIRQLVQTRVTQDESREVEQAAEGVVCEVEDIVTQVQFLQLWHMLKGVVGHGRDGVVA
nr:hypothetical protein BaRGS_028152 [Batillaria attramentaria]